MRGRRRLAHSERCGRKNSQPADRARDPDRTDCPLPRLPSTLMARRTDPLMSVPPSTPTIVNSSVERTRVYLTSPEVEKLIETAGKSSRYGRRDATMILIALSAWATEVFDLQWHQVDRECLSRQWTPERLDKVPSQRGFKHCCEGGFYRIALRCCRCKNRARLCSSHWRR